MNGARSATVMQPVYVKILDGQSVRQVERECGSSLVIEDYDENGQLIGIEIINAISVSVDGESVSEAIEKAWRYESLQ